MTVPPLPVIHGPCPWCRAQPCHVTAGAPFTVCCFRPVRVKVDVVGRSITYTKETPDAPRE